jgi:hypothetical protein
MVSQTPKFRHSDEHLGSPSRQRAVAIGEDETVIKKSEGRDATGLKPGAAANNLLRASPLMSMSAHKAPVNHPPTFNEQIEVIEDWWNTVVT